MAGGLGYERPPEDRISVDLGYATRRYRLSPDALGGDLATLHGPTPSQPRGGVLARLEGGGWLVTLFGLNGDHPPTEPDGFVEFARSLRFTDLYEAIRHADPVDDPVAYRFPTCRWRRFERLTRFPEGLVVLGDGVCSFNPVYGQGISIAAIEALIVRDHLTRRRPPRTGHLRARLARVIRTPWTMALAGDVAIPGVQGPRTATVRAANSFVNRVLATAADDTVAGAAFVRVSGLVDPPIALLRPRVALRALWRHPAPRPAAPGRDSTGQQYTRREHTR